ncbi:MAG TPA: YaiO family outer membrane beta-barrel protein [Acidobacteriaceae bacterium]|nr:YaiO family outer membrane beta-barrel protein [Acidobacteriaceae bacterium]
MPLRNRTCIFMAAMMVLLIPISAAALTDGANDPVIQARQLAYSGKEHRAMALVILKAHLAKEPTDSDARVLYGIVLSWEGRYDESREELKQVLATNPDHSDALPALINVELWSGHPADAEMLARDALSRHPDQVNLLMAEAKAFHQLNQNRGAVAVLNRVLVLDPGNQEAVRMRRRITIATFSREFSYFHTYDWFSDGRNPQNEDNFQYKSPTPWGSMLGIVNRADRFSEVDYQGEVDFYPSFRPGTYGYLAVGHGVHGTLYPSFNVAADIYQSIPDGFEASGGYRRLEFSNPVDIYTFALAKYFHNWLFTGRGFVVPSNLGPSGTALLTARYFLGAEGQHDYVEFRYSRGASPAEAQTQTDIDVLASSRYGAVLDKRFASRWSAYFYGNAAQDERIGLDHLWTYEVQGGAYYRF